MARASTVICVRLLVRLPLVEVKAVEEGWEEKGLVSCRAF